MTKYVINGGKTLNGEVTISGAKNAAVAIVPAALLADGPVRLENVPKIIDVTLQMEIMRELGAQIRQINATTVEIQNAQNPSLKPHELERKLRASYYLLGVLLGKYGFAEVAMPGGCNFGGVRPIDQHIKGFEALGAKVTLPKGGYIRVEAPEDGLHGAHIYFDVVTVGATMNIMLAAVLAKGQTIMENCAKEPHIVDLANFLNAMGADVKGAGTDVIKIRGVESLHGGNYSIIPDQIEAGTFMAAVAACGGSVLVKNVIPRHLECITAKLREMSVEVTEFDDAVLVRREGKLTKTNIKHPAVPGLPDRHAAADDNGAVSGRGHQHHHEGLGQPLPLYRGADPAWWDMQTFMWTARSRLLRRPGAECARSVHTTCAQARRWLSPVWQPRVLPRSSRCRTSSAAMRRS